MFPLALTLLMNHFCEDIEQKKFTSCFKNEVLIINLNILDQVLKYNNIKIDIIRNLIIIFFHSLKTLFNN